MFTTALLTAALTLAAPAPKEGKVEPGKIEGEWIVEKYIQGGMEDAKRSGMHMSFAEGMITVKDEGKPIGYTVDPKATPAKLDLMAGKDSIPGIYKVEGDTLTICFPKGGQGVERPTKFEAPAGTPFVLLTLKREKK